MDVAVLVLNGGSTSWKSALYERVGPHDAPFSRPRAAVELSLARGTAHVRATAGDGSARESEHPASDAPAALAALFAGYASLGERLGDVDRVGHRIVHGGPHLAASVRLDDAALAALRAVEPMAPAHNPIELAGIAAARERLPAAAQVAAFDTAFHRTLPPEQRAYAGPAAWLDRDIRRYGFHGISVAYCVERAAQVLGRDADGLRLAVAHLGGGCSVTAVAGGASVATTMGFTPTDGVAMATRSGSVDPGILLYLMRGPEYADRRAGDVAADLERVLDRESGLAGLARGSGDVREVEAAALRGDGLAALALDVYVTRIAQAVAAMLPPLGGLDALVFAGGVGAGSASVRARVCAKLAWSGLALDAGRNACGRADAELATAGSAVRVLAIETREEWYVARECARVLG